MRIAALYDIHGNLPALDAVLAEVRRDAVDVVVVGGDVTLGPMPSETLERLEHLDIPTYFILGNCDESVLRCRQGIEPTGMPEQAKEAVRWAARQLDEEAVRRTAAWPLTVRLDVDDVGPVVFCHATPRNNNEIFTLDTPDDVLRPVIEGLDASLLVCGHTHMPFDRRVDGVRVVNAGSVGMPFGPPGAYWLSIDSAVRLRRTRYDTQAAADRIRATGYPQAEEFAARNVIEPPSEAVMRQAFAKVSLT